MSTVRARHCRCSSLPDRFSNILGTSTSSADSNKYTIFFLAHKIESAQEDQGGEILFFVTSTVLMTSRLRLGCS